MIISHFDYDIYLMIQNIGVIREEYYWDTKMYITQRISLIVTYTVKLKKDK